MAQAQEHCLADRESQLVVDGPRGSPTDQLPDETLLHIFNLASDNGYTPSFHLRRNISTLIAISHVCQRWRCVTIDASALWSSLDIRPSPLRDACLVRSKAAPLEAVCPHTRSNPLDPNSLSSFVSEHIHRIQTLKVFVSVPAGSASSESKSVLPLNLTSAPLLRSITLSSAPRSYRLPPDFFRGYLPCLTEVSLGPVTISWSPPPFSSLRLTHLHLDQVSRPSLDMLLATLRLLSPTLTSLSLSFCLPFCLPTPPLPSSCHQTNLPMLTTLCLTDRGSHCLLFLHHVAFPKTTALKMMIQGSDLFQVQHCLGGLAEYSAVQSQSTRALFLSQDEDVIDIRASPHHLDGVTSTDWERHSYSATFNCSCENDTDEPSQIMADFVHHLPLTNISSCFMDGASDEDHHHWSSILASMPSLQYLSIGGCILQALIKCLLDGAANSLKFPSLVVVSIILLPWQSAHDFERLLELLADRERLGAPLKILYIEDQAGNGQPHFAATVSYRFHVTEVIGVDRQNRVWFHRLPGSVSGGSQLSGAC